MSSIRKEQLKIYPAKRIVDIHPQPDDTSCGPTCLHAVYNFFDDEISLSDVISGVKSLTEGGTLAVNLGIHALERGYSARLYTLNLHVFDPTWFELSIDKMTAKMKKRAEAKGDPKLSFAIESYLEFLNLGGEIHFRDFSTGLLKKFLFRNVPVISGLSSTFLYRSKREIGILNKEDDVLGDPAGHFVILVRYDRLKKRVLLADPFKKNPIAGEQYYYVSANRLLNSILLGIVTYDANLLIIEPRAG
ncbi:MAG TPA: hypothetical protein P5120_07540 [Spirochaetota bacterium]|nr:hypothetical protein [Spirochaetota bacterium]HPF06102.1 hypothetical protein [Spirochaetota bacterium]HPJ42696.1 hypothetical protein [Spirochaetota bacterium]HPR36931.1 hypothetical protein [Spirochaetota bacterium]HRX47356.1 hypothetical protein [Spirochaetota bacterium]